MLVPYKLGRQPPHGKATIHQGPVVPSPYLAFGWFPPRLQPCDGSPPLFCQREAAETAIFLTEVAGRRSESPDWRERLDPQNAEHNDGLPRVALKMATGSGKTTVMALLAAWSILNKVQARGDGRFSDVVLVRFTRRRVPFTKATLVKSEKRSRVVRHR